MKRSLNFAFFIVLLTMNGLFAQSSGSNGGIPLKHLDSPLFGKDIVINDQPTQDQRSVAICAAFNGWLYAFVANYDSLISQSELNILRSMDTGITWDVIYSNYLGLQYGRVITSQIVALGDSVSNLKLFWATSVSANPSSLGGGYVERYNGITGAVETAILNENFNSGISLASDYNYKASNSAHQTLGVVFSTPTQVTFRSSSNGGISFDNTQTVATTTTSFFHRVSLNYGRSPSFPNGRYYAAWESQANQTSNIGHIYTAHSNPNFDSPFTTPVCLDSLDASGINKMKNPVIACQYSSTDNDSSNFTEVVMAEKQLSLNNYDTKGFYNLQAATSNHFNEFTLSSYPNNKIQSDINYNPFNSTFMLTCYDSVLQALPFLTHDVNFSNPGNWDVTSQSYNDYTNLIAPFPKVNINLVKQSGMNTWISEGNNGNGVAMFDASYSTYTGISEIHSDSSAILIGAYPNPCSNNVKILFQLKNVENVTITIMNSLGQPLGTVTNQTYSEGKHVVQYDVSKFQDGIYIYSFRAGDFLATGKILIIK